MPTMIEDANRTRDLIEELRADIDFELDDVLSGIVSSLPEDYFRKLERRDQITHLKALLALNICQIDDEIMLRSDDNRHVAVIARRDFPGLLANIIKRLPANPPLVGAKIFSSRAHDFIIDLFDFASDSESTSQPIDPEVVAATIRQVATEIGLGEDRIAKFISRYPTSSYVLTSPSDIQEHFLAFQQLQSSKEVAVRWTNLSPATRVTMATYSLKARDVFQNAAELMGQHSLDIQQAFLNDLTFDDEKHIAIASFVVTGDVPDELKTVQSFEQFLKT